MRVRCSFCGHVQTLRRASSRRTSQDGKRLFQCSNCHRYSPISENITQRSILVQRSKHVDDSDVDYALPIDLGLVALHKLGIIKKETLKKIAGRETLEKLGIIEKEKPKEEPKKKEPEKEPFWGKPLPNRP